MLFFRFCCKLLFPYQEFVMYSETIKFKVEQFHDALFMHEFSKQAEIMQRKGCS